MGTEAAWVNDQPSGILATIRWSVTAVGPKPPLSRPMTRSPGAIPVTSGPTSTTTPAPSMPIVARPGYMSSAMSTSRKFSPAACTATRIWPLPRPSRACGWGSRPRPSRVPLFSLSSRQAGTPGGGSSAPSRPARTNRGAYTVRPRRASCCSPVSSAVRRAGASSAYGSSASSRTNRSGFSDWAERSRPHTGAAARSGAAATSPSGPTAPLVSTSSRAASNRGSASHCCTRARARCAARCAAVSSPAPAGRPVKSAITTSGTSAPPSTASPSAARSTKASNASKAAGRPSSSAASATAHGASSDGRSALGAASATSVQPSWNSPSMAAVAWVPNCSADTSRIANVSMTATS
ncbi:hypothetical protein EES42_42635 [Streptomyces sp. ADI95-17]|nr:hypothetical protein EES42_42635 [Streptomyces sp. ADI95-17]